MPELTCYKARHVVDGQEVQSAEDLVDSGARALEAPEPVERPDFTASLFVWISPPRLSPWGSFLRQGFGDGFSLPGTRSSSALLVIELKEVPPRRFVFAFGLGGRFLLKEGAYVRGYGLRTALNLIYPRAAQELDLARLRGVDTKRHGSTTTRARLQASRAGTLEMFDIDRLRDVLDAANGSPADEQRWGRRVVGADALHLSVETEFDGLGQLCRDIDDAYAGDDYRDRFAWVENIQPVAEPTILNRLEEQVVEMLQQQTIDNLDLAPPEIIDPTRVESYRFDFDARQDVRHPDLRLRDYLAGLASRGQLPEVNAQFFRRRHISALDGDGATVHRWSVWRCLTGEIHADRDTFVLDAGDFFSVSQDYLSEINAFVGQLPATTVDFPSAPRGMHEDEYNRRLADALEEALLLDRQTVTISAQTTPIELCDVLTSRRELIHVKRKFGSRDLSHLFSQGAVSAELLQADREFRVAVRHKFEVIGAASTFLEMIDPNGIRSDEFEVVYAIVGDWAGRDVASALPFFSKVNLRRTAENLRNRGFRLSWARVQETLPGQ